MNNILHRIRSLSLDEYWIDVEKTLANHRSGPSLLIETAFKHLHTTSKDVLALQCAIVLFQVSVIIADDIADEDTKGIYLEIGAGRAANLAVALGSASYRVILESDLSDSDKLASIQILKEIYDRNTKATELECRGFDREDLYWRVVSGKSGQVCGNALRLGATLADADEATAARLYTIGNLMGEIGQVCNDFAGAFKIPANSDWQRSGSNILMLFAMNEDHPSHQQFIEISKRVADDESTLREAQQMLLDNGAVSYAGEAITDRLTQVAELALKLKDAKHAKLASFFADEVAQALKWLEKRKIAIPDTLSNAFKAVSLKV